MVTRPFLIILLISMLLASCTTPKPLQTEEYHEKSTSENNPVVLNGLQKQALKLMNENKFESSITFLQRAIKVEPRNPLNWHYLAQNYWQLKDFPKCRAMVQRAQSYMQYQPDLIQANDTLLQQCSR